jgi:hypothetical protein
LGKAKEVLGWPSPPLPRIIIDGDDEYADDNDDTDDSIRPSLAIR